jgi:uncharacterized BrkB/YihY/UPF0761 family membrane protein
MARPVTPPGNGAEMSAPDAPSGAPRSRLDRARAGKQQLVERAQGARERLERSRSRSSAVDAAFRTMERDAEVGGGVLAAAMGFRIFLFLVPYVFVFVAGFGLATDAADQSAAQVAHEAGVRGLTARAISGAADLGVGQRIAALVVGGLALFLAARSLCKTLRITHSLVWRVGGGRGTHTTRAALVLIGVLTGAYVVSELLDALRDWSFVVGLVATIASLLLPVAVWLYASMWLPHDDAPWWALLPGSVLVGIGAGVLQLVTVYWIAREVSSKSDTYGAIGTALALLLWAYLLGRIFVASAALNAALWRRRPIDPDRSSSSPANQVGGTSRRG